MAPRRICLLEHPVVGLKDARELHFAGKKLLGAGINPMGERKAEAEARREEVKALQREADSSFENVGRLWWAWWSIGKSPRHAGRSCDASKQTSFLHSVINPWTRSGR